MSKTMELIKELGNQSNQRYYQLDFKIYKHFGTGKEKTIKELVDNVKLKEPWVIPKPVTYVNKICISDAHRHIERLVFPVIEIENSVTGERKLTHLMDRIDGKYTFMTHGGSPEAVYHDRTYVRHLRELNKEGVK